MLSKKRITIIFVVIILSFILSFIFSTIRNKYDKTSILIENLKSLDAKEREKAEAELVAMGEPIVRPLQAAFRHEISGLKFYLMIRAITGYFNKENWRRQADDKGKIFIQNIICLKRTLFKLGDRDIMAKNDLEAILSYVDDSYLQEKEIRELAEFFRLMGNSSIPSLMEYYRKCTRIDRPEIFHILLLSTLDSDSVNILLPYLNDSDKKIRALAAELLGYTEDRKLYIEYDFLFHLKSRGLMSNYLYALLSSSHIDRVEMLCCERWENLSSYSGFPRVISSFRSVEYDERVGHQELVKKFRSKFKNTDAVPYLIKALDDPSPAVTATAVRSLGFIADTRASAPVARFLEKRDDRNLLYGDAIKTLGFVGDKSAVKPLLKQLKILLDNNEIELSCGVIRSLGLIGDSEAVPPLLAILNGKLLSDKAKPANNEEAEEPENNYLRLQDNIIIALGFIGDERAVEPLIEVLSAKYYNSNWSRELSDMAAFSLGMLKDKRALKPLKSFLKKMEENRNHKKQEEGSGAFDLGSEDEIELFKWAIKEIETVSPAGTQ